MRYFITGYRGFIGKHIRELALDNVFLYGRGMDVERNLKIYQPEIILHLAAEIYKEDEMFDSNVKLTYELLKYSLDIPYKAFIYVGSSSEYGRKDHPMIETDYLDPTTMYEATKGCGTLLCQAFARRYNKPIVIVRPFSLYGKHEGDKRFIPTIVRKILRNETLEVSEGAHDFIHIDDFIRGILMLIDDPKSGEIFNFGTGKQYTNKEVVKMIEKVMRNKANTIQVDRLRTFDSMNWVANIDKSKSIGWMPKYDLEEGLKQVIYGK